MSKKIIDLTELTAPATNDVIPVVDVSANNEVKKMTLATLMSLIYPIGTILTSVVSTNPATLFGFGTWVAFGAGRVPVGLDANQTEFDTIEETGGAKTHTLQTSEIPAHSHVQNLPTSQTGSQSSGTRDTSTTGSSADALSTANTGGGGAHNNLQPYIVVYMWKRTA